MKNYAYYLLMYALGGSIGVGHAMNTENEYSVIKLTLPLEALKTRDPKFYEEYMKAEGDYHEAELKFKQAKDDLTYIENEEEKSKNLKKAKEQFDEVKQTQQKIRDKYKETEAFKAYHKEVLDISEALKKQKIDNQHVVEPYLEYPNEESVLFKKLSDITTQREQQRQDPNGKGFCMSITVTRPNTKETIKLPAPDINSAQYKKFSVIEENVTYYHHVLENKAYHDELEDLRIAKVFMEINKKEVEETYANLSWLRKVWLNLRGRNTYKKKIVYHTQALSNLDNEIDSFMKEDYSNKARDAFSRSCMLRYTKDGNAAEAFFKNLKYCRGEYYDSLKSNNKTSEGE